MQRIPKFPITVQTKEGDSFKAFFKPTGNPKTLRLVGKSRHVTHTVEIPTPQGEVLSWGGVASRAFAGFSFVVKNQEGTHDAKRSVQRTTIAGAPLQKQKPQEGSSGSEEPKPSAGVLSAVRSHSASGDKTATSTESDGKQSGIVFVKDARLDELYQTAQQKDPAKHYTCRFEGKHKNKFVLQVYFPSLREWSRVEVDEYYMLKVHPQTGTKENNKMKPTKNGTTAVVEPPVNAPQATTKKGLTVYEAWGKAFETHGTKKEAPELIVKFMEENFPGRKTKWAKWVNPVRARYNAGKLPGVTKPKDKLAVYKFDVHSEVPARTGKERREKKERRTPPLKSIRAKAVKAAEAGPKNLSKAFKLPKKST